MSIEEVIDFLKSKKKLYYQMDNGSRKDYVMECLDTAINLLSNKTMWIPVSERLPEIQNYSDNYLVTLKRGGVHIAMFTECDGKHWWTYDDVEAWMPLPEPYKAE